MTQPRAISIRHEPNEFGWEHNSDDLWEEARANNWEELDYSRGSGESDGSDVVQMEVLAHYLTTGAKEPKEFSFLCTLTLLEVGRAMVAIVVLGAMFELHDLLNPRDAIMGDYTRYMQLIALALQSLALVYIRKVHDRAVTQKILFVESLWIVMAIFVFSFDLQLVCLTFSVYYCGINVFLQILLAVLILPLWATFHFLTYIYVLTFYVEKKENEDGTARARDEANLGGDEGIDPFFLGLY